MSDTALLEALPVAVYTTDAMGRITFYNEAAAELWGHRPRLGVDRWCGSWRLYWPDGRPLPHDECPMAVALKEGRPVRGVEAVAERPDGTRINFLPCPTPLRDTAGQVTGAINLLVDLTDRNRADLDAARLAAIVAYSNDAIVSKTLEGRVTSWNAAAVRIFGYEESEMIGQPITRIIPPDLQEEEKDILARIHRGERVDHYDTVRVAKDGRRLEISLTVSPLRDKFGRVVGASKIARDVTERKQAEKLQRLLIDELNHRVKNTLATVQAIVSQSLTRAASPAAFVSSFTGRLQALARVHAILSSEGLQGAEIGELVHDQVMLGAGDDHRISCSGPSFTLDPQAATHLALVLHELGTNARKYGALSSPSGRLSIGWRVQENGGRRLLLDWIERDGPKVTAPHSTNGFGTTLIKQTLRMHGGDTSISFDANGVTCRISLPLPDEGTASLRIYTARQHRPASAASELRSDRSLKGKRILVIEDEMLLSMEVEETLREAGCEVVGPAGTLDQAKRLIADAKFDAAVVDANLAGRSVEELATALTLRNVPFAFVTGYGRGSLPQGFHDALMMSKPFGQDQLLSVVGTLICPDRGVVRLRQKPMKLPGG